MPRPLRTSCDRCHSQKLKCPKQPGSTSCTRCARAGAPCIFSPAGPSARRALATPPIHEGELPFAASLGHMDLGLDWSSLDLDIPVGMLSSTQVTPPQQTQGMPEGEAPISQTDGPRPRCVQQLSALAAELDHVYTSIPPATAIHLRKDRPASETVASWASKYSQSRCLEQFFTCAQRLLDLYPGTVDLIFSQPEYDDNCNYPDCIHREQLPPHVLDPLTAVEGPGPQVVDTFLLNLVHLCHSRVNDVLQVMLSHFNMCARAAITARLPESPHIEIPELRVGNFVASPESSSSMQAVLIAHIASVLTERAKQLAERVASATKDETCTKKAQVYRLQCELMAEAAGSRLSELNKMRDAMARLGFVK